ncbi:hypothetical protein [Hamadaea tsunoensis]|uniref:hypothetical protein n=1 Tax=Hamadaea tsunoensis TaxID=53368 RepID=UPI00040CC22E|nr:hypothetical protein [Hamadaea tsunoensis]
MTTVEVLLLSQRQGMLRYRAVRGRLETGMHPDDLAVSLAGLTLCTRGALVHSTSWRYADDVVLTYAALPDPTPGEPTQPVPADAIEFSASPLMPSPYALGLDAVASHAGRHLALLLTTDPVVAGAAVESPELWELVGKLAPGVAGSLSAPVLQTV